MLPSKKNKKLNKTIRPASPKEPTDVPTAVSTRTAAQNPSLVAHTPKVERFLSDKRIKGALPEQYPELQANTAVSTRTATNYPSLTAHTPQVPQAQRFQSQPRAKESSPRQLSELPTAVSTRTAQNTTSLVAHTPQFQRFGSESAVKKTSPKQLSDVPTAVSSRTAKNTTSLVASNPQIQRVKSSSPKQISDVSTAVSGKTALVAAMANTPPYATQQFMSEPDIKTAPMQVYTAPVLQNNGRISSPKTATLGTYTARQHSIASTPSQTNSSDFGLINSTRTGATQLSKIYVNPATEQTQASYYAKTTGTPFMPVRYVPSSYASDNTFASAKTQLSRTSAARTTQHSYSNPARTTQQSITPGAKSDRFNDITSSGCNTTQRNISVNSPRTDENLLRSSFLKRDLFSMKTADFEILKKDLLNRKLSGGNIDITDLEMIKTLELNYSDMSGNNLIESSEILKELIGERTVSESVANEALEILIKIGYITPEEMLRSEEWMHFSVNKQTSLNSLADIVYKLQRRKKEMSKKKNTAEKAHTEQKAKPEEIQRKNDSKEDPVSRLKDSLARLTEGMKKLEISLGVETSQATSSSPVVNGNPVESTRDEKSTLPASNTFERPDMTAEEKKAQRLAKAADKKARAEQSAAKKAAGENPPSNAAPDQKTADAACKPHSNNKNENTTVPANSTFERPDMTAEEKKAQRLAKAVEKKTRAEQAVAKKTEGGNPAPNQKNNQDNKTGSPNDESQPKSALKQSGVKSISKPDGAGVKFDLTPSIVKSGSEEDLSIRSALPSPSIDYMAHENVHPAFLTLAMRSELDLIEDLDQLCKEFISGFKEFFNDWIKKRDIHAELTTMGADLGQAIKPQLAHLTQNSKWPLPFALGNIVRQLKKAIAALYLSESKLSQFTTEDLLYWLNECERSNFDLAYQAISKDLREKLKNTPSVLVYDWCPVINNVLLDAFKHDETKNIKCTVVDSEMNGNAMRHVQSFLKLGVRCRYTDLKSVGYAMQNVKMVLIGCSAVLSNGCIVAPKGSIQIALIAKAFNVPLLVVSQSFKFVDKALTYGRMALMGRESTELVPQDLITAIVTDIRILHPSSAPAVLKAKALEQE